VCGSAAKPTQLQTISDEWHRFDMENATDRQQLPADHDLFLRLYADKIVILATKVTLLILHFRMSH